MRFVLVYVFIALIAMSCSSISANYNVDPDADFSQYTTFNWDEPLNKAVDKSYNPIVNNSLVNNKLKKAIEDQLTSRGYKLKKQNADLLINFHTMVESKSKVTSDPNNYYFWWRNNIQTINYTEGTIIIDIIDAKKDQLVWQGYSTGTINENDLRLATDKAVIRIFEKYPYRAGMKTPQNPSSP